MEGVMVGLLALTLLVVLALYGAVSGEIRRRAAIREHSRDMDSEVTRCR